MTKQEADQRQKQWNFNFDFHEDTQSLHCRKCGQWVGEAHPCYPNGFVLSSSSEGDEANGICYDCVAEENHQEEG